MPIAPAPGSRFLSIIGAVFSALLAASVHGQCPQFTSSLVNLAPSSYPYSVAIGDFNGDGKSDLAIVDQGTNTVAVVLGTGTGSFGAASYFATGTSPFSVAVGDFNGDGKSDLAIANNGANTVSILLGTGTGSFGLATNYAVGINPDFVAVGDFNGDGKSDLAVANYNSPSVSILLGTGAGTFLPATNFASGVDPASVSIGDFNGDGKADLAIPNFSSNTVAILLGIGAGSFGAPVSYPTGTSPISATIGDFNGDGKSDLAVANYGSDNVSILLGTGTGSFGAATNFAAGSIPYSVALGDFNGDGKSDLAIANGGSNNVSILLGTGGGTFAAASNYAVQTFPAALVAGDFNGDSRTDLAVANASSDSASILINSTAPGTLALSSATYSVGEGAGTVTITVNRTGGTSCGVTVNYATSNGTATAGSDYTATSGTLTFGDGVSTASFTVPILNDSVNEANESFGVTLSSPTGGASLGAQNSAVVTIVDDDAAPQLTINNVTQAEGTGGTTNFVFTVTLTGTTAQTVTVNYATADGTATAPADYTSTTGTLTFPPGTLTQTITVPVVADAVNEVNETFTVGLSGATVATIATLTGTGTIQNDDAAPTLAIDNVTQAEGTGGSTNFVFTVTLTGATGQTVTVNYATADGTASAPADYTSTTGTLSFPPGTLTQTITVPVVADAVNEANETFTVGLSGATVATIATGTGNGTIQNDDAAPTLAIGNVTQAEGTGGSTNFVFTITLTGTTAQTVTVNYATADGTATAPADYTSTTGTLTFPPGTFTQTITVPVIADALNETNEAFAVVLSGATIATVTTGTGTATIQDDDAAPTLAIGNVTQAEGTGGSTNFVFTITLTGATAQTVTVNYATVDGTATAPADYTSATGTLTFPPGTLTQTITVPVVGDALNEANETFTVGLSGATVTTIATGTGTGTIQDDDAAPALAIDNVTQAEGTGGTTNFVFTVALTGPTAQTVTVNYATADGTATAPADYASTTGTLTFPPGTLTQTITVPVIADAVNETNEAFTVVLSGAATATITTAVGTGNIVNDDGAPTLLINSIGQTEGSGGTTNFDFTVTLAGATAQTVTVNYTTADGTATAPADYAPTTGTLSFPPGTLAKTITVPVVADALSEASETFTVALSNPVNATLTTSVGTGTIQDDDAVPTLSIDSRSQLEGNSGATAMTFTVTLSAASGQPVTVSYATADGTATAGSDYTATAGSLTFAPGQTSLPITVMIAGDTLFESDETFHVTLSSATSAAIAAAIGIGTIQNDEAGDADLSITNAASASPLAGRPVTYNIAVTNAGPNLAAAVVVTDVLPAGATFVSATPSQGTCSGTTTVICSLGVLASGGGANIVLVVKPAMAGPMSNTATVSAAPQPDPNSSNDQSTSSVTVAGVASIPVLGGWAKILLALTTAIIGFRMTKRS